MEEYLGDIKLFAGTFCPKGYKFCEGQTISISENQALFSVLGSQYGGDGKTTFNLPNLSSQLMSKSGNTFVYMKYIICTEGLYPARPD